MQSKVFPFIFPKRNMKQVRNDHVVPAFMPWLLEPMRFEVK
jgi:hypothetical protein